MALKRKVKRGKTMDYFLIQFRRNMYPSSSLVPHIQTQVLTQIELNNFLNMNPDVQVISIMRVDNNEGQNPYITFYY